MPSENIPCLCARVYELRGEQRVPTVLPTKPFLVRPLNLKATGSKPVYHPLRTQVLSPVYVQ